MEFKGIKGNWEVVKGSDSLWIESALWSIADVNKVGTLQEYNANAKLIAAAPELLDALQGTLKRLNDLRESGRISLNIQETFRDMEIAEEVINKALN